MPAITSEPSSTSAGTATAAPGADWIAAALLLVPSLVAVWISAGLVTDIPWGDHLTLVRDTRVLEGVTLESLWRFHNEHLIVPTRLAVAADYWLWHGANALPALWSLLFVVGIIAVEARVFRRAVPGLGSAQAAVVTALLAAILLNGRLTWTLTFPILLPHASANFFVVATLAAFATLAAGTAVSRRLAGAACLAGAGLAAISAASGVFALPAATAATILLATISPTLRRCPWRGATIAAAAAGLLIVAGYAVAYATTAAAGPRSVPNLPQALRFAIYFPGGAWFRNSTWPIEHFADPLLLHAVVLGFWLVLAFLGWRIWQRRHELGEFEIFHVSVVAFVVITAGVGGLFRADLGYFEALSKKYATTALLAWASVTSLVVREAAGWLFAPGFRGDVRQLATAVAVSAAILPGDLVEFRAWQTWQSQLRAAAMAYAAGARSDEVLLRFFPNAREAERLLAPIAADRAYWFRHPATTAPVPAFEAADRPGHRLARVPDHEDYALEFINEQREPLGRPPTRIGAADAVSVRGWAVDREAGRGAAVELVVAGRRFQAEHGLPRLDVAEYFSQPGFATSGFQCLLPAGTLPPGEHELRLRILLSDGAQFLETPAYRLVIE